jgi:hypothetical protein
MFRAVYTLVQVQWHLGFGIVTIKYKIKAHS